MSLESIEFYISGAGSIPKERPTSVSFEQIRNLIREKKTQCKSDGAVVTQLENLETQVSELEKCEYFDRKTELVSELIELVQKILKDPYQNDSVFREVRTKLALALTEDRARKVNLLAKGTTKTVFVRGWKETATHVFGVARGGLFGRITRLFHEREMREELVIAQKLGRKQEARKHLAIDIEEAPEGERIGGRYTLKSSKATCNLAERLASTERPTLPQVLRYGSHLLQGLADMHEADYVHGDIKPENIFLYGKGAEEQLKLADFGKARKISEKRERFYLGNAAYGPPEAALSPMGEVDSAGIMLIRMLETPLLKEGETSLVPPELGGKPTVKEGRLGIERFVLEDRRCPQVDRTTLRGKFVVFTQRLLASINTPSEAQKKEASGAVWGYIDELITRMEAQGYDHTNLQDLKFLLQRMTQSDPTKRPTIDGALREYNIIMEKLNKSRKV